MTARELIPNHLLPFLTPGLILHNPNTKNTCQVVGNDGFNLVIENIEEPEERVTTCPNCVERLKRDFEAKYPFDDQGLNI